MPALPNVNKVLRVACQGTVGIDTDVITRFFIAYAGTAPLNSDLNTFAAAVGTAWGTDVSPLQPASASLGLVTVEDLTSPTGAVGADGTTHTGGRAGTLISGGTAMVTSYHIARRYRGGHPRGYWPVGVSADLGDAQQWGSTFKNLCQTNLTAFFTAVLAAPWAGGGPLTHVNVSYYSGFTVHTNPTTGRARNVPTLRVTPLQDLITGLTAQTNIGTQRRRN